MFVMALGLFFYFKKNGHTPNVNVGFLRFNRKNKYFSSQALGYG